MNALEWSGQSIMQLYFRCSSAANFVVGSHVLPKFKLIQAFIAALLTCKNEEVPFKNEVARVFTTDLSL